MGRTSCKKSTKEIIDSAVETLGDFKLVQSEVEYCDHLIMEKPTRTLKTLFALARGVWILSPAWVYYSLVSGRWESEEKYEWDAYFPGARLARIARENGGAPLLSSCRVFVSPSLSSPPSNIVSQLCTAAGGEVVSSLAECDVCIAEDEWHPDSDVFSSAAPPAVKPEWLFDSLAQHILHDKAPYLNEWSKANSSVAGQMADIDVERSPSPEFD